MNTAVQAILGLPAALLAMRQQIEKHTPEKIPHFSAACKRLKAEIDRIANKGPDNPKAMAEFTNALMRFGKKMRKHDFGYALNFIEMPNRN